MQLKKKNITWMYVLALFTLLVGVGIQLALALARDRRAESQAGELAQEIKAAALTAAEEHAARLDMDTQPLVPLPAQKAAAYEDLHLELLILVNPWNPLPEGYTVELQPVRPWQEGEPQEMDVRCADALLQMLDDCEAAGNMPYVCSSYRTQVKQEALYYNKLARVLNWGYDWETANAITAQSVAVPGTSEHQLGLAADIIDYDYTYLDEWQEQTGTQQWLMANSWRYGFILRYPNGTTDITGIIYEPWHYRYVGTRFAKDIYDRGVTLEEYIALRRGR